MRMFNIYGVMRREREAIEQRAKAQAKREAKKAAKREQKQALLLTGKLRDSSPTAKQQVDGGSKRLR